MAYNYSEPGVRLRRPAGREGRWNPNGLDDEIVCPYFSAVVPGGEAIQALDELRAAHSNITPIIAGTVHNAGLLFEGLAFRQSARSGGVRGFLGRVADTLGGRQASTSDSTTIDPLTYVAAPTGDIAKTLEAARSFDIGDWLADARAKEEAVIAEYGDDDERDAGWPPRGEWPDDAVSNNGPWLIMDQPAGSYRDSVIILGIDTDQPSDIAAHLQFGGWNACPPPHIHVALARRWGARFGAIPIGNSNDTVEFAVAQPIKDRETALMVAEEHYVYCSEGAETIDELAASLIGAKVWSFWWD